MRTLPELFQKNREWALRVEQEAPGFFEELAKDQAPDYLWIGCSDSRVPANQIVDLSPGDMFVHRNIANVVLHTDLNCLSVIQYAVEVLKVKHIIVCGHYGCGGVRAAMDGAKFGLIDNWLRVLQDMMSELGAAVGDIQDPAARFARFCELNAVAQAANVCRTTLVQNAWANGQELSVHGWIYDLADGLLRDLAFTVTSAEELDAVLETALSGIAEASTV